MSIKDKEEQNNAIDAHSQEIEEMIGREPVKSVIARNTRLWDWARTVAEKAGNGTFVRDNQQFGFLNRSNLNQAIQSQKIA